MGNEVRAEQLLARRGRHQGKGLDTKTFKTINRPQHHADQALGPHTGNKEPLLGCEGPKLEGGAQRRRGGAGLGVPLTGR